MRNRKGGRLRSPCTLLQAKSPGLRSPARTGLSTTERLSSNRWPCRSTRMALERPWKTSPDAIVATVEALGVERLSTGACRVTGWARAFSPAGGGGSCPSGNRHDRANRSTRRHHRGCPETTSVSRVEEDALPCIAATVRVVEGAWVLDAQGMSHGGTIAAKPGNSRSDPHRCTLSCSICQTAWADLLSLHPL